MRCIRVFLSVAVAIPALALGPAVSASDLRDRLNLGEHWYGPKLSKEDLKQKVVLFVEARSVT